MRSVSETWAALAADGSFRFDAKLKIGDAEYDKITAPRISRPLLSGPLTVGGCMCATLKVSILTEDTINSGTEVEVLGRLTNGTAATVCSEWLSFGTFWIATVDDKSAGGIVTLEAYDDMILANASAFTDVSATTQTMTVAVNEIAASMGLELDDRTVIETGAAYTVTVDKKLTKRQVLGYIAACHGGNWIITEDRKLRLVPLLTAAGETAAEIPAVIGKLMVGEAVTVSGVWLTDVMEKVSAAGTADGYVLQIGDNPYVNQTVATDLLAKLGGLTYQPYTATTAVYDPALEPGDPITIGTRVTSFLCNQELKLDHAFRGDLTMANSTVVTETYSYQDPVTQQIRDEFQRMAGDLQVDGSVAADALYAPMGDIVDLTVNRLRTANFIKRYLARNMSDADYINIEGDSIEFRGATTDGSVTHAKDPYDRLLYWKADVSDATLKDDGWPYDADDNRIFTTTEETEWPVQIYVYDEGLAPKRCIRFDMIDELPGVIDTFGVGDGEGGKLAWIVKSATYFSMIYRTSQYSAFGERRDIGVQMNDSGYMDLYGVRRTSLLDLSEVPTGKLYEMVDGIDQEYSWTIERDSTNRPVKVIDDIDGHETQVRWWD